MYTRPCSFSNYTIPRTTRELQQVLEGGYGKVDYTIPRTTRELQQKSLMEMRQIYYTIPRTTRELQPGGGVMDNLLQLYHTKNYQGTTT